MYVNILTRTPKILRKRKKKKKKPTKQINPLLLNFIWAFPNESIVWNLNVLWDVNGALLVAERSRRWTHPM